MLWGCPLLIKLGSAKHHPQKRHIPRQAGLVVLIVEDKKSSITTIRNAAFYYFVFGAFVVLGLVVAASVVLAFAFLVDAGLSINLRQSS